VRHHFVEGIPAERTPLALAGLFAPLLDALSTESMRRLRAVERTGEGHALETDAAGEL
jgi:hypothetical protein